MDKKLIEYLPYEVRKYEDYQVITESEDIEFSKIYKASVEILDETFIESATNYGITRLENMLKLYPNDYDTLQDRKLRLIAWWNNQIPYTWRVLIEKLNTICGIGNYEIKLISDRYIIELKTRLNTSSQYEDLLFLLERIIPANIEVYSSNTLLNDYYKNLYLGLAIVERKKYIITHDYLDNIKLDISAKRGHAISEYKATKIVTEGL